LPASTILPKCLSSTVCSMAPSTHCEAAIQHARADLVRRTHTRSVSHNLGSALGQLRRCNLPAVHGSQMEHQAHIVVSKCLTATHRHLPRDQTVRGIATVGCSRVNGLATGYQQSHTDEFLKSWRQFRGLIRFCLFAKIVATRCMLSVKSKGQARTTAVMSWSQLIEAAASPELWATRSRPHGEPGMSAFGR
jgi:hypothetical protein